MKESELKQAPEVWQSARYSHYYTNYMAQLDPEECSLTMSTNTGENPRDLDKSVFPKIKFTIPAQFFTAIPSIP